MLRTFGEIKNFKPIKFQDNVYTISWGMSEVFENTHDMVNGKMVETGKVSTGLASWYEFTMKQKPSVSVIKDTINDYINDITTYRIINNYVWNGYNVSLSKVNQTNYKAAYDLAVQTNGMSLPVKFKFSKNGAPAYYTFENIDELTDFYVGLQKHINTTLEDCWTWKDSVVIDDTYTM